MKKYLIAAAVFIAGFFAVILFMTYLEHYKHVRLGQIPMYIMFAIVFAATRMAYQKFKTPEEVEREERSKNSTDGTMTLSNGDWKNFQQFVKLYNPASKGIQKIMVQYADKTEQSFVIWVISSEQIDEEKMQYELHRIYYPHITFSIAQINPDEEKTAAISSTAIQVFPAKK